MKTANTPSQEISRRISAVQKEIQASDMDALLIKQRMDLFYFSGTAQNGFLFIPARGNPLLMIKKYLPRAEKESSIKNIIGIDSVKEVPKRILDFHGTLPKVMGLEFDVMPVREYNFVKSLFKIKRFRDGSDLIHTVRMIKSDWEIEQIQHCAKLTHKTFKFIEQELKPGLTEIQFAGIYETFERTLGHQARLRVRDQQTEIYNWHILSGKNGGVVGLLDAPATGQGMSPAFPCGASMKKIKKNEPIMIDIGFVFNGYHVDETRMFAIEKMPAKAMKASQAAIEIHNSIIEKASPGIQMGEIFRHAVDKAAELGYEEPFLGPPGYKVTFVGHGIGLELVESPVLARNRKEPLLPGMVFALEPKMVFKDEFSAGIESVFMITEDKSKVISRVPAKVFIAK